MTTYSSDEPSLSGAANEKEPTSILAPDQNLEDGKVGKEHRAGDDVDPPSPRKVHGISVRRLSFHPPVLDMDTYGYLSGYWLWLALCLPFYCTPLTILLWPTLYR